MTPALPKNPARFDLLLSLTLLLLCALAFYRVCSFDFIPFDDDIEITTNPHIQSLSFENIHWMFTNTSLTQRYIPFSWLTWTLTTVLFGLRPAAFHAFALIVHCANTLLLFTLIRSLLRRAFILAPRALSISSALAAASWAVHPLRVEVVAWATQVRFAEASFFALLSVLLYIRAVDRFPRTPSRSPIFWCALLAYVASIFFYPIGIGIIALLPLLDIYLLKRPTSPPDGKQPSLRFFYEKIPFLIPAVFIVAVTLFGRFTGLEHFNNVATTTSFDIPHRFMQAAYMFFYYVWKPFDLFHIAPIYAQLVAFNPFSPIFLLSLAIDIALTLLAFLLRPRAPAFFLLWAAHLLLIFPVGGYFDHPYYPSDRYAYLQGALFAILLAIFLAQLFTRISSRSRAPVLALAFAVIATCALLSNIDSKPWTNGETFFHNAFTQLGNDPYRADVLWRLGKYYSDRNDPSRALDEFNQSLAITPGYPRVMLMKVAALNTLADRAAANRSPDAAAYYTQAAATLDDLANAHPTAPNLEAAGDALLRAKNFPAAIDRFQTALLLNPNSPTLHQKLTQAQSAAH